MRLDAHTLYAVLITAHILLGFTMLYAFRRPFAHGEEIWTRSLFVGAMALMLLTSRNTLPDPLSLVLANVLVSVQYSLQYWALCKFFERPVAPIWLYAPSLIAALAFSLPAPEQEAERILISGTLVGIQHIPMFLAALGGRKFSSRGTRDLLLLAIALNAGRFFYRAGVAWAAPESTLSIFGPVHAATLLLALIYVLLATFVMVILYRESIEARLRGGRRLFESIVEGTSDSIFTKDKFGRYQFANRASQRFMGRPLEDLRGRDDHALFPAAIAEKIAMVDRSILESGQVVKAEVTLEPVHGDARAVLLVKGPLFDESGAVDGIFGISRDISEYKQLQSELGAALSTAEQANEAKSRFLAAASHDLRQPLQAINLFSDALGRAGLNDEQKRINDYLSLSVLNLRELLDALLDISRLDSGSVKACPEPISAEKLFARIDSEYASAAVKKSLRFKLYFPFAELLLLTDRRLLLSLLGNIVSNAVKYTERGGILVGVRRRGQQALLQVWDTGVGIEPEHMERIFEEYFQIGNRERDRMNGLGLGLAIARRVARLLDTEVVCRSRPGRGSVFEFLLPLADASSPEEPVRLAPAAQLGGRAAAGQGRRVVVVDDDTAVRIAIKLCLEAAGLKVSVYDSAEAALAAAEVAGADFYISDYRLPGMDGAQLLDIIEQRAARPIKALLLTGEVAARYPQGSGGRERKMLYKPVSQSDLLAAMQAAGYLPPPQDEVPVAAF